MYVISKFILMSIVDVKCNSFCVFLQLLSLINETKNQITFELISEKNTR